MPEWRSPATGWCAQRAAEAAGRSQISWCACSHRKLTGSSGRPERPSGRCWGLRGLASERCRALRRSKQRLCTHITYGGGRSPVAQPRWPRSPPPPPPPRTELRPCCPALSIQTRCRQPPAHAPPPQADDYLSRLEPLLQRLNEGGGTKFDRKGLAQLISGLAQFMEDALGVNVGAAGCCGVASDVGACSGKGSS